MKDERSFFLQILSDYLLEQKTVLPIEVDWLQISKYAKSHQIDSIIANQCISQITDDTLVEKMKAIQLSTIALYASYRYAFNEIQSAFIQEKIKYFFVKGIDVACYYPNSIHRTMSDMDIIVYPDDKEHAANVLKKLGYTLLEEDYVLHYKKGFVNVELHDHLIYSRSLENETRRSFFNTCWDYVYQMDNGRYYLDNSFHYLFLVEHTKKHFRASGIGFRQFIDLAVFSQKCPNLDWKWIINKLHQTDLWTFATIAHTCIYKWWGIPSPYELKVLDNDFFEETTEYIFKSGVFGFENKEYPIYVAETRMSLINLPKPLLSSYLFFKKIFLSYDELKRIPHCAFVSKSKLLLPIGWIYRIYYIFHYRKDRIRDQYSIVFSSKNIMDKHKTFMQKWGI